MNIYYQISTHWDREWYKPFQGFRYKLVKAMDNIIDALEQNKIDVFTMDGQTIVLEDYLEIKPENRRRLEGLITTGRLKVGPWYVMPDLLTVSGESIIKNFLYGSKIADAYRADVWRYGYLNDIFGHIAQMPQILNQFNIEGAYLGRGAGCENYTNYVWKSPDGSECYICKQCYADLLRDFREAEDRDAVIKSFIKENEPASFLNYTFDHAIIDDDTYDFCRRLKALSDKYTIIEGLENSVDEMKKHKATLPVLKGELIKTGEKITDFRAVTHSISSYYPIKAENDYCEQLLEETISPIMAYAYLTDKEINKNFCDLAYKYLLKNQPHDSICGCSVDTVHKDMAFRYSQVKSISDAISEDFYSVALEDIASTDNMYVKVHNFSLKQSDGIIAFDILFDKKWSGKEKSNTSYSEINTFELYDNSDNKFAYQILDIESDYIVSVDQTFKLVDKYTVAVDTVLPSLGNKTFKITPNKNKDVFISKTSDGNMSAENEFIRIEILPNGELTLTDKETEESYSGLNRFIDDGECGNGWFHEAPYFGNNIVSSSGFECITEKLQAGDLVNQFKITKNMKIPASMDYAKNKRSSDTTDIKIITTVTLYKHSKYVEFGTEIFNTADDHRMRVEFPTNIISEKYCVSQAFCFVERNRGISKEGAAFREPEAYEKNTSGIVCAGVGKKCLSFIGKYGFHEAAVSNDGTISATLFRSFGRVMPQAIKSEYAQLRENMVFNYAISTETNKTKLLEIKSKLGKKYFSQNITDKANTESLFDLNSDSIAVSIVKMSENSNGVVIRLYNPNDYSATGTLTLNVNVKKLGFTSASELDFTPVDINKNIPLEIEPYKIISLYAEI